MRGPSMRRFGSAARAALAAAISASFDAKPAPAAVLLLLAGRFGRRSTVAPARTPPPAPPRPLNQAANSCLTVLNSDATSWFGVQDGHRDDDDDDEGAAAAAAAVVAADRVRCC